MIKKILSSILSMEIMGMSLLVFAFSIGFATFVEHRYGTVAAKGLIYNAWWFELILAYAMVTLTYNVFRHKMYAKGNWGSLVFHMAFVIMILGAGITRYMGMEGTMSIREDDNASAFITTDKYLTVKAIKGDQIYEHDEFTLVSMLKPKSIKRSFTIDGTKVKMVSRGVFQPQNHGDVLVMDVLIDEMKKEVPITLGSGLEEPLVKAELGGVQFEFGYGRKRIELPFALQLNDFVLERYAGSMNPSSYKSLVTLIDNEKGIREDIEIKMNHVLDHRGYRFFQSSYDTDERGTVLSVNKDLPGTLVSYLGYFLLILGILMALFDKKSRFVAFLKQSAKKKVITGFILFIAGVSAFSQNDDKPTMNKDALFKNLWVQSGDGRIKPMIVFADEVLRKVSKGRSYNQTSSLEVLKGMFRNPSYWMREPLIATVEHPVLTTLGITDKRVPFLDFYDTSNGTYLLMDDVRRILAIPAPQRSTMDNHLLTMDERVQICRMLISGNLPMMFPQKNDAILPWASLAEYSSELPSDSLKMIRGFFAEDDSSFYASLSFIHQYQEQYASEILPSPLRQKLELLYFKLNIFERLALYYGLMGMLLMIVALFKIFSGVRIFTHLQTLIRWVLFVGFLFHTFGLISRWIISGHMPLSNGYESVVFVAWAAMLAGLVFSRRNTIIFSLGAIMAAFAMLTSHMSFMNPQITHLVPVLKSYWLMIHVTMVTTSYGFLGASFVIGYFNLILMIIAGKNEKSKLNSLIDELYPVGQMSMEIGLYMITIGCFLGGIWANVSWGRYWSWDPKETWCLVSIVVYAFVMHMHHIPGFGSRHYFSAASVIAFSSILMTYFGVNYFLGGMHGYAGAGAVTLSTTWYIVIAFTGTIIIWAGYRYKKN